MDGTDHNGPRTGKLPVPVHSAVRRLEDIQAHQWSLAREIRHNWRGWLGSLAFHAIVLVSITTITWTVISEKPFYIIDPTLMPPPPELVTEPLPNLFPEGPEETEVEGPPSLATGGDRPSIGYPGLDDTGLPDWIGRGPLPDGRGLGGPPGDFPVGRRLKKVIDTEYRSLDVVFVFDSTGSMGGILLEVKNRIRQFMKVITYLVPNTQLGLVSYRDKRQYDLDDYEYTVKFVALTRGDAAGLEKLQGFLRGTEAYGGGDIPEAVYEGVLTAIRNSGWRKDSKKIIIVFGDAPPRPEDNGLAKIYELCRNWHRETGGIISCIDTTGGSKLLDEFSQMAAGGGGQSSFLNDERAIIRQLVLYVFPKDVAPDVEQVYRDILGSKEDTILQK